MTCATCPHLIKDDFIYCCGLERTEISDVDVSIGIGEDAKPFNFQPEWCIIRGGIKYGREIYH